MRRLASFVTFPQNTSFSAVDLAKQGYIYKDSLIECSKCGFTSKPTDSNLSSSHAKSSKFCTIVVLQQDDSEDGAYSGALVESTSLTRDSFGDRLNNESDTIAVKVGLGESKFRYEFERIQTFLPYQVENYNILGLKSL